MRVVIFDRATMSQIGAFGNRSAQPGDFDIVHHMAPDSKGNPLRGRDRQQSHAEVRLEGAVMKRVASYV
jgi:hypothetical protein